MLLVSVKFILLLHFVSQVTSSGLFFTSVKKLRKLAEFDVNFFLEVKKFSGNSDDEMFNENIILWSNEVAKIRADVNEYIGNPLNVFKLIKRNAIDLHLYAEKFHQLKIIVNKSVISLPTKDDLVKAAKELARLQKFYKLKTHDFAYGVINGLVTDSKLTPQDLLTISNILRESGGSFESKLAGEYYELLNDASYMSRDDIFDESFEKTGKFSPKKDDILMQQACRGEISMSAAEKSRLYCYYHSTNLFTKLAPFKAEVVNIEPLVLIFIDIISEKEIEEIMKIYSASETTEDATIGTRISAKDQIKEENHEILKKITQRSDVSHVIFMLNNDLSLNIS